MKKILFVLSFAALSFPALAADIYVDIAATGTPDGLARETAFTSIQAAIEVATTSDIIKVYPGTYSETAPNKTVNGASYQFGLFFGIDGVTVQGQGSGVIVQTNATNNFGPSGIFVAANDITLDNLEFSTNASGLNKTIEVIGDNFTITNSKLTDPAGGVIYINDFTPDSKVNKFTVDNNIFESGANITLASGVGSSTDFGVENRKITNNLFKGTNNIYARISFSGAGGVAWYLYPVGGAVITGNTFEADNKWAIRARGEYHNDQFNWKDIWDLNTFSTGATVALSDVNAFALRDYSYSPYSNVRGIGSDLSWTVANASTSDTVLIKGTTTVATAISVNKPLTIKGVNGGITTSGGNNVFAITSSDVSVESLNIAKTDKASQQLIALLSGSNISIKNNTIRGQFVIGEGDVSRGMVVSGGLTGLTIDGNTIFGLRQPAYVSGTTTGTISNNYVYGTKGWVLEGGDLTLSGNTWGTGSNANVFDVAILGTVPAHFYTDIVSVANANNDAVIEDQRMSPAKLSVAYVDGNVYSGDLGGRYHPYANITDAGARIVSGGKVIVLPNVTSITATPTTSSTSVNIIIPGDIENTLTSASSTVLVEIASSTTISGPATWNGVFSLPVATTTTSILPGTLMGNALTGVAAIEIGSSDVSLSFSSPIKLTFQGKAGMLVGWSKNNVFTRILNPCDSATNPTLLTADADCRIDVGGDLVVWTRHATTFIAYSAREIAPSNGGGGVYTAPTVGVVLGVSTSTAAVMVTASTTSEVVNTSTPGTVLGASTYAFARNLGYGAIGDDVTELQKILMTEGYLKIKVATRWFGPLTKAALTQWQAKNGIPSTGFFGTLSRGHLAQ